MKKIIISIIALIVSLMADEGTFEKEGFLTSQACAEQGAFKDCYMENYACGSDGCYKTTEPGVITKAPLVLFSHKDGIIYKLDTSKIDRKVFDEGVSRNGVTLVGEFDSSTNTIIVHEFKVPPPAKKSFFKGCL